MSSVNFIGCLPRSLSTVLTAILAQNPRFAVTATSPMLEIVTAARKARSTTDFKALSKSELDQRMPNVIKGIIEGWFTDSGADLNFDKCRGWIGHIDLLNSLYASPKIIAPIRDIRGVVASMERLRIKNPTVWTGMEGCFTIQSRVEHYLSSPPLGAAIERLFDAYQRGLLDSVLIVRAEDLATNTSAIIESIYAYLGEPLFAHDYENIQSATYENDAVHEPFGEHHVSQVITKPSEDWNDVLTPDVAADIRKRCAWFYDAFYPER